MKKQNLNKQTIFLFLILIISTHLFYAQCKAKIKIDGVETLADLDENYGIHLPYWLKSGQSLAIGSNVSKISVIEFNVDTNHHALNFSQVKNINVVIPQVVPEGKVWKIESIAKLYTPSSYSSITYSSPGTYSFNVPLCAESICIEVWGAGGGGGNQSCLNSANCWPGGGAGGGGFGSQCFNVIPGANLTVIVGAGGGANSNGGSSSVNGNAVNISATGGLAGANSIYNVSYGGSIIATGGMSTANSNAPGANSSEVYGGAGGNGGAGGSGSVNGGFPGGGGGGAQGGGGTSTPGKGGSGKVVISW